jgi:hypothetical protein
VVFRRGALIFEEGILGSLVSSLSSLKADNITVFINVKISQHDLPLHLNTFESYYRMQEDLQEEIKNALMTIRDADTGKGTDTKGATWDFIQIPVAEIYDESAPDLFCHGEHNVRGMHVDSTAMAQYSRWLVCTKHMRYQELFREKEYDWFLYVRPDQRISDLPALASLDMSKVHSSCDLSTCVCLCHQTKTPLLIPMHFAPSLIYSLLRVSTGCYQPEFLSRFGPFSLLTLQHEEVSGLTDGVPQTIHSLIPECHLTILATLLGRRISRFDLQWETIRANGEVFSSDFARHHTELYYGHNIMHSGRGDAGGAGAQAEAASGGKQLGAICRAGDQASWILSLSGLVPGFQYKLHFEWFLADEQLGALDSVFSTTTSSYIVRKTLSESGQNGTSTFDLIAHSRKIRVCVKVWDMYPRLTVEEALIGARDMDIFISC